MKRNYLLLLLLISVASCTYNKEKQEIQKKGAELFLPGKVNTNLFEMNASFSKSSDEFFYSVADPFQNFNAIVSTKKQNNGWGSPEVVSFSGRYSDFDPFMTYDGSRLCFCSRRPLTERPGSNDANIWYVEKKGHTWSEPQVLDSNINSAYDEYYVSVSRRGTIFFTSTKPTGFGSWDIYYSSDKKVFNIGEPINSEYREWDPFIAADESFIIFTSSRPNGFGGGDLYISFKKSNGEWDEPENLGEKVNTSDYEYCPSVSRDSKYLYFSRFGGSSFPYNSDKKRSFNELKARLSSTDNGLGSIYRIKLSELKVFDQ